MQNSFFTKIIMIIIIILVSLLREKKFPTMLGLHNLYLLKNKLMKKLHSLLLFGVMSFITFGLFSCSQDSEGQENSIPTTPQEKAEKVDNVIQLFDSYGWKLDTTIDKKERDRLILEMDYNQVKGMLEEFKKGWTFDKGESGQSRAASARDAYQTYYIEGSHSNYFFKNIISHIDIKYTPPTTPDATVIGSRVSSNPSLTWSPDEYKTFYFSGSECQIEVTGNAAYKPFYSHKQIMKGWVRKESNGFVRQGAVTDFHETN